MIPSGLYAEKRTQKNRFFPKQVSSMESNVELQKSMRLSLCVSVLTRISAKTKTGNSMKNWRFPV